MRWLPGGVCCGISNPFASCRQRHADVLEWLWFLQTHFEHFEGLLLGDKDMYQLAFSLAGKAEEFAQVSHHLQWTGYTSHV